MNVPGRPPFESSDQSPTEEDVARRDTLTVEPIPDEASSDEVEYVPVGETRLARRARAGARSAKQLLLDHRYLVLSALLLLLVLGYVMKNRWAAGIDVWEHAAAARELGEHPLHPQHPLFAIDRPHQLLSPYHFVLGLVSRFTGLSIFTVFGIASVANVLLLLVGLRMFTARLLKRRHVDFYAVLFILFLWGANAWFFSGFLHFNVFPFVLPYPSTFAKGLVLVGLAVHLKFLDEGDRRALAFTVGAGAVLLLVHPVDALFFFVGLAALAVTRQPARQRAHLVATGAAVAVAALLALAWPHYSLYDLLFGAANENYRTGLASADRDMYANVLARLWPALVAVPFVVRRLIRRERDDALILMLGGLLLLYGYGWRTEQWQYGRLLSAIMVVVAIILADERAKADDRLPATSEDPGRRWVQYSTLALVLVGMFQVRHGFIMLPDSVLRHIPYSAVHAFVDLAPISEFEFLSTKVGDDQVVMSDFYTSMEIPAFGPKVVGLSAPEAFVDTTERYRDLGRFYDKTSSLEEKRAIAAKYGAKFLLLTTAHLSTVPDVHQPLLALGPVVYSNNRFVLIDLEAPGAPSPGG